MRAFGYALAALGMAGLFAAEKPAYVTAEKVSGHIGFYTADGKVIKEVSVGGHPHELAFSPDGRYVYCTDNGVLWMTEKTDGGNTVSIIDIAQQKLVGTIDLGKHRRPHGIAAEPKTGNLLITTELPAMLLVADPRTRKVIKEIDIKGKAPHLVKIAPDGVWAYTSNTDTGNVTAVNLTTGEMKLIPVGERPQGMAFSPDGRRMYVTNLNSNSLSIVDTEAKTHIGEIPVGKGPVRVVLSPDGKTAIYALQTGNAVGFANLETRKEELQIPLPGQPVSVTLSQDGKYAFSAVQAEDKIFVIPLATRKIEKVIETPKGAGPDPYLFIK